MKKGFFSSLILASSLFVTSVATAEDYPIKTFSQQYPHLYVYLADWFSTAKVSTTITVHTLRNEAFGKITADKVKYAKLLQKNNASINCLKKFDNSKNLPLETQALLKKLSPKDLQFLDNYYQGDLGKAEIEFGRKATKAAYSGDFNAEQATYKLFKTAKYQTISQQIYEYENQHKAVFEKYHNALMTPEVTKIEDDFIKTCKS